MPKLMPWSTSRWPNFLVREPTVMAWLVVFPGAGGMALMVGRGRRGGLGS